MNELLENDEQIAWTQRYISLNPLIREHLAIAFKMLTWNWNAARHLNKEKIFHSVSLW